MMSSYPFLSELLELDLKQDFESLTQRLIGQIETVNKELFDNVPLSLGLTWL